jgi:hypothetical protein
VATVLIAGVPRSGTTWTGRALGATDGATYLNEPDGFRDPFAFRVMLGIGENPVLRVGAAAPDYERLWTGAFAGGRRAGTPRERLAWRLYERSPVESRRAARAGAGIDPRLRLAAALAVPPQPDLAPRHVVVKSVQCALTIDWIADRFRPRVLVVERHPFNVLASWIELDFLRNPREIARIDEEADRRWGLAPPGSAATRLELQTFQFGVLACALRESAAAHPEWVRTTHEHLCVEPLARLRAVAGELGLEWGDTATRFVTESEGDGTTYRTQRRAQEQPDRWRERLDAAQVATIRTVLDRFPYPLVPDGPVGSAIIEP